MSISNKKPNDTDIIPPSKETINLLLKRILPILVLGYIMNFLDRTNISMVKSELEYDLGIDAAAYGFGAGLFFITYAFFQVPTNLIMHRFGVRRCLGIIMLAWGIISVGTAFIRGPMDFYFLRLCLGIVESGFYPGVIYYLTRFFPHAERGRANSIFLMGAAIANVIGNPLAGLLVGMHGFWSFTGWQWLFILEGLPSVILAIFILKLLPDQPTEAKWLNETEAQNLEAFIAHQNEQGAREAGNRNWKAAIFDKQIILTAIVFFTIVIGVYSLGYFLPAIVKGWGTNLTTLQVGMISSIPYIFGGICLWVIPLIAQSDKSRFWIIGLTAMIALGLVIALLAESYITGIIAPIISIFGFCLAYAATQTVQPMILANVGFRLSGAALAGGLAMVNMIGQLGGFFGPYILGYAQKYTGLASSGLWAVAGIVLIGTLLSLRIKITSTVKGN